ncbi:MAG TPA: hypothetical protein VGH74_15520 [Planctomycetaceae bacterium]|jgi:hypothetical protein
MTEILAGYRHDQPNDRVGLGWTWHACTSCGEQTAIGPTQTEHLAMRGGVVCCMICCATANADSGRPLEIVDLGDRLKVQDPK